MSRYYGSRRTLLNGPRTPPFVPSLYMIISASVTPTVDGKYDVYSFNSSGTFFPVQLGYDVTEGSSVTALVIAGGGGAGSSTGSTGGAGGYKEQSLIVSVQNYPITVGGGGGSATQGGNSSIGTALVLLGGGTWNGSGQITGGSGGGAFKDLSTSAAGLGTTGQGFNGGASAGGFFSFAGGGGAGGVGGSATGTTGTTAGQGGPGLYSSITGISVGRGGGGDGLYATGSVSSFNNYFPTNLGFGGGSITGTPSYPGMPNTGGGGCQSGWNNSGGFPGGSGVVIIRVRARA